MAWRVYMTLLRKAFSGGQKYRSVAWAIIARVASVSNRVIERKLGREH